MNQITLFTVVYPGCEPYLDRFFRSVREQEMQGFNLIVLNDGLKNLQQFAGDLLPRIDEVQVSGTIAEVRRKGLQLLMECTGEKIVFADADDYISTNRMRKADAALDQFDIYVNDLTTVDDNEQVLAKNYLRNRLGDEFEIDKEFILDKNVIGLGNTSVRKSTLRDLPIPPDTVAVDWMIFTDMLLRGSTAIFRSDSESFYRQHEQNTAGLKKITIEKIRRALTVQIQNASYFDDRSDSHKIHLKKLLELESFLTDNNHNINIYKEKAEELLPNYPLWWEEIQSLDRLHL